MSESDKSGKPELTAEDKKRISSQLDVIWSDYNNYYETGVTKALMLAEYATLHERSAAQVRIAELEAISKALIKTLQVSLPIVSAPLRETFEIAIAKAKDKLLKP